MTLSPAQSLTQSAAIFRKAGQHFSADFTASLVRPAEIDPALYSHWASAQADRAARVSA